VRPFGAVRPAPAGGVVSKRAQCRCWLRQPAAGLWWATAAPLPAPETTRRARRSGPGCVNTPICWWLLRGSALARDGQFL